MGKNKKTTIKDLARETGYSKTSISFAFNNPSRISKEACIKIKNKAKELNYFPDPLARSLSLHKHFSIGFLLPQNVESTLNNPYILKVIQGICSICQKEHFTLTIIPSHKQSSIDAVKTAPVDGIITMGMDINEEIIKIFKLRKIPIVAIDGNSSQNISCINTADEQASYDIMKRVLEKGHKKILIVSLKKDVFSSDNQDNVTVPVLRLQGYKRALEEANLKLDDESIKIIESNCTFEDGQLLASKFLKENLPYSVIVTMSDIVAIGILYELRKKKIEVPKDISVVGFDNIRESKLISPRLTTVDQPALKKGEQAAELMFDYLENRLAKEEKKTIQIQYKIIMRESLGNLKD